MKLSSDARRGFTLTELLVATTIFAVMMGITMVAYTAAAKRVFHTEAAITGTAQLRYASDMISRGVRSAPQPPVVSGAGLRLTVIPEDAGVAIVTGPGTPLDANTRGYKSTQKMVKLTDFQIAAAGKWFFSSSARPAGKVTAGQVGTYFKAAAEIDLNKIFKVGDDLTIPATRFGSAVTRKINSISNSTGNKTVTFETKLGVDVPEDTRIYSSRRVAFEVTTNGDLRYYPDANGTTFTVLARDVDPSPRLVATDSTSANTTPFVLSGRVLTLNLQKLPRGTVAGRTSQGVQTTVYARTDPTIP